jgi:hypothetical protein
MSVTYRLARDEDGAALGKLFRAADYADHGVDWETAAVGNWWLLAEREGEVRGAVQIIASRPWGYIGEIVVHPDERGRRQDGAGSLAKRPGTIGYKLYMHALALLQEAGVEVVMGVIHEQLSGLQKIVTRYGATELGRYKLYGMRLKA